MTDSDHLPAPAGPQPAKTHAESLADRARFERILPRLQRTMLVASILLIGPALRAYHAIGALGFAFGAAISCINFRALSRGVEGLTDRVVNRQSREKGGVIVFRFIVRYALVGIAAYAIFRGSALAFRGFLWGLCVPVAAMMFEAGYEAYAAFRK